MFFPFGHADLRQGYKIHVAAVALVVYGVVVIVIPEALPMAMGGGMEAMAPSHTESGM